jgi:hypothetical protein
MPVRRHRKRDWDAIFDVDLDARRLGGRAFALGLHGALDYLCERRIDGAPQP